VKSKSLTILSILLLLPLLGFLVFGCGSRTNPTGPNDSGCPTPRANKEAEEAALWLSDSLIAPESLYYTISYHLKTIREKYGETIPQVDTLTFRSKWRPGMVILQVTEEAKQHIRAGTYHDLDSLNSALHLEKMDTTHFSHSTWIHLIFEGRLHPKRLAELYSPIPSVVKAVPIHYIGDWPNVYPWFSDNGITYLFREAWGDCLSGCIYSLYWYFKVTDSGIEYIGFWDPETQPEPDWWEEAKMGYWKYRGKGN